jgi:hypothetical protein
VKRLVRTSNGWLELDVSHLGIHSFGTSVRAAFFADEGWASKAETWNSRWRGPEDEGLESFLARISGIPTDEAARIGQETLEQWRARGGEAADRPGTKRTIAYTVAVFSLAAVGALALLIGAVIAVWKLV